MSKSILSVQQCFTGPNPYAPGPVIKVVWNDAFLSQQGLIAGIEPMSDASAEWIEPIEFANDPAQDQKAHLTNWITHWTLHLLNARRGRVISFGSRSEQGQTISWLGYHHAGLAHSALVFASNSLQAFAKSTMPTDAFSEQVENVLKACRRFHPDYQMKNMIEAADTLDIPYFETDGVRKAWQFGWGCNSVVTLETGLSNNSYLFHHVANEKPQTKNVLRSLGLPVGTEFVVTDSKDLPKAAKAVGFPCVTKPVDGKQSQNVTVDIRSEDALRRGYDEALEFNGGPVIVEEMRLGNVYRLMLFHGQFQFAIRRTPATVTGDGTSTIEELLEQKEKDRLSDPILSRYIGQVPIDEELHTALENAGYTLSSVPPKDETLTVRLLPRSSRGGSLTDVTNLVHPSVKLVAVSIARAMRLQSTGLDYVTSDISKPPTSTCGFIEVNAIPSLSLALAAGVPLETCVNNLLGGEAKRIPANLCIYGSKDELYAAKPPAPDPALGWVRDVQCGLGDLSLTPQIPTTVECTRTLLRNPMTQRIEIAMTEAELQHFGLPLDHFDHIRLSRQDLAIPSEWHPVLKAASNATITFRDDATTKANA